MAQVRSYTPGFLHEHGLTGECATTQILLQLLQYLET